MRVGVDGSTRRLSGEPQPADRWATTADSIRGADDSSAVGCRVPCAPRSCRSAGGRDSTGLRVKRTHGAHVGDNARAHSSAFSRVLDDTCRRQGRVAAQAAANAKQQKPPRCAPLFQNSKLRILVFILPSYLLPRKSVRNPKARRQVSKRNVPMPVALLARVTHHAAMSCTSGRAQWPIKPLQCAPDHTPRHRCGERDAPQNRHRRPHPPEPADSRMNAAPLRPIASVRLHNRGSA